MKIESFTVDGLHGTRGPIHLKFQKDLNILSGKNGAGKTTILKMIWYFISGNLEKAFIEVPFKYAELETDFYNLYVKVTDDQSIPFKTTITYKKLDKIPLDLTENEYNHSTFSHIITQYIGSSYFLPTFRILEGGFSTEKYDIKNDIIKNLLINTSKPIENINLENDFRILSQILSKKEHKFITSVSSSKINELLISKYAEIMSHIQPIQNERQNLINEVLISLTENKINKDFSFDHIKLEELQSNLKIIDNKMESILKPLNRLESTLKFFIKNHKINFGRNIFFTKNEKSNEQSIKKISETGFETIYRFEDAVQASFDISSLSAGEKQILSFLAYNAFFDNTIFFIDEPEISLHADWQRILFRILQKQNSTNQFIISTHSPFIYSKYPDKEICMDPSFNRGNEEDFRQDVESKINADYFFKSFDKTNTNYESPLSRKDKKGSNNE